VASLFGEDVASLVDGVTKLSRIPYSSKEEIQAESFRKMFLAMAKDIRVVLIKLADRLHNMRTMKHMSPEKQVEKARETLDIYAPLAHRLGIYKIKWELEDLCLRYIDRDAYYELVGAISQKRSEREQYLEEIVYQIQNKIKEMGITAEIEGRPKHFYSIYRKMKTQDKEIDQIYDLFATRIIVDTVADCYAVLGLVHELYKPMPGRFKDYIAMPKPNMYQSLHTTVIGPKGIPFEVQIRTMSMHRTAEYGIAAHWRYKENTPANAHNDRFDGKLTWLRQLLEWQKDMRDAGEFMETLKSGLVADEVFVFTPKGEVRSLPAGSVPIDFAYNIHSGIGNRMYGAKVNGRIVPLTYELKNGDIVEILTSEKVHGPSRDWLKIVKSTSARNKISQWFKKEMREENVVRGKEIVEREIKKTGFQPAQLLKCLHWMIYMQRSVTVDYRPARSSRVCVMNISVACRRMTVSNSVIGSARPAR
jgi:guanosine-3',5'-bis(diphosphate) 3'-pyrophosphohydrolase